MQSRERCNAREMSSTPLTRFMPGSADERHTGDRAMAIPSYETTALYSFQRVMGNSEANNLCKDWTGQLAGERYPCLVHCLLMFQLRRSSQQVRFLQGARPTGYRAT